MLQRIKSNSKRPNPARLDSLIRMVVQKNVFYSQGIPRSMNNIEEVYKFVLISPQLNLTLTSGAVASTSSLDPTVRIDTWSRWTACFKQYIVAAVRVESGFNKVTTQQGQVFIRVGEDSNSPASTIVRSERGALSLVDPYDERQACLTTRWQPRSAEDMNWTQTSVGFAQCYLQTYADPTNTGTSAADSTSVISHVIYYTLLFRYLAA
jgi:hypothetical protein